MSSQLISVADSVKDELNATAFSQTFVAVRYYEPTYDLHAMPDLHVSVVPRAVSSNSLDRGRDSFEYEIDIAVQKKTEPTLPNLDALMELVEEIGDHLRLTGLANYPAAHCVQVSHQPIYSSEHLHEFRIFTSVLSATYRVWR